MICPNLSDPNIRAEFNSLKNVVGEDFAYFLWNRNQGNPLSKKTIIKNKKEVVVDNSIYSNFLSQYQGNEAKAIFAVAVTFSNKFKKQYPGFDGFNSFIQSKVVHSYITKNGGDLDALATKIIAKVNQGFKAERFRPEEIQEVSREMLQNISDDVDKTIDKPTGRQLLDAYIWFSQSPLSNYVGFANLSNIVNQKAFAQWTKDAITLYQGSDSSDLYHESFHEFTQRFLTKAEKAALYELVRSRPGNINLGGTEIPHYSLTNRQIEEVLAESFRTYSLNRSQELSPEEQAILAASEEETLEQPVRNLFQRIMDFLRNLFTKKTSITPEGQIVEEKAPIDELFEKLYRGNLSEYKPSDLNIEHNKLNRTKEFTLEVVTSAGEKVSIEYTSVEGAEILSAIDYYFNAAVDRMGINAAFFNNSKLKSQLLPKIYDQVKTSLEAAIENYESQLETADPATAEILEERINSLKPLVYSKDGQDKWAETVEYHKGFSKGNILKTKEGDDTKDIDSVLDEVAEEDRSRNEYASKSAEMINPIDLASPEILELIKTLPDIKRNELGEEVQQVGSILGLPQVGDYLTNKNLILNTVSGIKSYSEAIQALVEKADLSPQLLYFVQRMPKTNGTLSIEEEALKAGFLQFASMPTVVPLNIRSTVEDTPGKKPVLKTSVFVENTLSLNNLMEYFDQDFIENSSRKYRNVDVNSINVPTFSVKSVLADYVGLAPFVAQDAFRFFKDVFGVDLYGGVSPSLMFDRKGNFIPSSNLRITPIGLKNILTIAKLSVNKMVLMDQIARSGNLDLIGLTPQTTSLPLSTWTTDISSKLQKAINALKDNDPVKVLYKQRFGSITTFKNERRNFFNTIESFYNLSNSASYLNLEKNLEWSIREWNHMIDTVEDLNKVKNLSQLKGHLSPETNNFIKYSAWGKKMFDFNGDRKKNLAGEDVSIEVLNFSGMQTGIFDGKKTTNLSADSKLVQDFLGFLKDRTFENIRAGAKNSAFATRINGNLADRTYHKFEDFIVMNKTVLASSVQSQFTDYLKFEVSRMYDDRAKSTPKEVRGSEFIILQDILSPQLQDELKNLVAVAESKESLIEAVSQLYSGGRDTRYGEFKDSLTQYFQEQLRVFKAALTESIADGKKANFVKKFNQTFTEEGDARSESQIDAIILAYITNYYTHQIEYMHMLVGDPSNFNAKGGNWREVFKRLGGSISPGKQPHLDDQTLLSWNSEPKYARLLEQQVKGRGKSREYDENFKYIQFKDIKSFTKSQEDVLRKQIEDGFVDWKLSLLPKNASKAKKAEVILAAKEEIKTNLDDMFAQDKESDAQAYANLDFIRFYLNSIDEWSSELEEAYNHEVKVLEAIKAYRANKGTKQSVLDLIEQSNKGILTSLKLGYYGSPLENTKYVTLGKYSVFNLLPSAVFNTDLESFMFDMFEKGVDFATFDSGNKMSTPVESIPFYKEDDVLSINNIPTKSILTYPISGLRRQQYIAPKFKNEATLSTQMVKLLFGDFYINGEINPAFAQIQDKMDSLQQEFINMVQNVVNAEKAKIYTQIEAEVDENGVIKTFSIPAFKRWLFKEFDKKDIPNSVYVYIDSLDENEFIRSIDGSSRRDLVENVISSALSKRVLKPKMFGEAYIQLASSGFNQLGTRFKKPSKEDVSKYGTSGLRDYRVENGKTQPADIKIAFNPKKHSPLLNLEFNGQRIATLARLNEALLDDNWVELHSEKITMAGVRIPVQGFNSMEYFRVREFLPTSAGPVIVVPPSIVTKSGSDFDIDKLFMYEPMLDSEGNIMDDSIVDSADFTKNMLNNIRERVVNLQNKKEIKELLNNTGAYFVKGLYEKDIKNLKGVLYDLSTRKASYDDPLVEGAHLRIKLLIARIEHLLKENPSLADTLAKLKEINKDLDTLQGYTPNNIKNVSSNRMIKVISGVLSEPALFSRFTKPNSNKILPEIAAKYLALRNKGGKISSTDIFSPLTSVALFKENTLGKKSLGVDAKMNALHKLFQQVGLRFNAGNITNNYRMKANRTTSGEIILGGYIDANNENLISDVINEFINGHVDIEKEDWINYFNGDNVRTPLILQMVLNGTPVKDAILLVNQPIIQHFLRENFVGHIGRTLGSKSKSEKQYVIEALKVLGVSPIMEEIQTPKGKKSVINLQDTVTMLLEDDYFKRHIERFNETDYPPYVENSRKAYDIILEEAKTGNIEAQSKLAAQVAFLTQYLAVKDQQDVLYDLTSNIDFNTNNYRNITDFFSVAYGVNSASNYFNGEAVEKILSNSVVSPFNIVSEAVEISRGVFDILALAPVQEQIQKILDENKYWSRDRATREVNKILNNFMHILISRFGDDYSRDLYNRYGRDSGFLEKDKPNNLKSKFITLFKDSSKPELMQFANKNLFLANFNTIDVKDSKMFYVAMKTNEKDPDAIDAIQKAFMDGLNHPNPEVSQFFTDVASATIVSQGFNIRFRSIQPYLPIKGYIDVAAGLSVTLKGLKYSYNNSDSNDEEALTIFREGIKAAYIQSKQKGLSELDRVFPKYKFKGDVAVVEESDEDDFLPLEEGNTYDDPEFDDEERYRSQGILNSSRGNRPVDLGESTGVNVARKSGKSTPLSSTDAEVTKCNIED